MSIVESAGLSNMSAEKLTVISGVAQIWFGCLQGFTGPMAKNFNVFKSTHHQFSHNGELLIALGVAASPVVGMLNLSPRMKRICLGLLNWGAWLNPIAYLIVAYTDCPFEMLSAATKPTSENPLNMWYDFVLQKFNIMLNQA